VAYYKNKSHYQSRKPLWC